MRSTWPEIAATFTGFLNSMEPGPYVDAVAGIEALVHHIAASPLSGALFGFSSMHDLCIHQTDSHPFEGRGGPYLRVSPQQSGLIEFRYVDTHVAARQWTRIEPPERTLARFDHFLNQLHWLVEVNTTS